MFYEGAEKKVEVYVNDGMASLRSLGYDYWSGIVGQCNAHILSHISSEQVDAYILSESSLFVWDNHFMIITCGQTVLVNSVVQFIADHGSDVLESVVFQREKEARANEQKTTFSQDVSILQDFVSGADVRFGRCSESHTLAFSLNKEHVASDANKSVELQLCELSGKFADYFLSPQLDSVDIRELLRIDQFYADYQIDDNVFDPVGYSLNGVREDKYITVHITPQKEASYISFKTNRVDGSVATDFQNHLIQLFNPGRVRASSINTEGSILNSEDFDCVEEEYRNMPNGYRVNLKNYKRSSVKELEPINS